MFIRAIYPFIICDLFLQISVEYVPCSLNFGTFEVIIPSLSKSTKTNKPPPVSKAVVALQENTNNFACVFEIDNDYTADGIVFYQVILVIRCNLNDCSFFSASKTINNL